MRRLALLALAGVLLAGQSSYAAPAKPARTRLMTVYDGSGAGDPAYVGDAYAQSPALRGAVNVQYPHTYHNDLRIDAGIVRAYRTWIERWATLRRR